MGYAVKEKHTEQVGRRRKTLGQGSDKDRETIGKESSLFPNYLYL